MHESEIKRCIRDRSSCNIRLQYTYVIFQDSERDFNARDQDAARCIRDETLAKTFQERDQTKMFCFLLDPRPMRDIYKMFRNNEL